MDKAVFRYQFLHFYLRWYFAVVGRFDYHSIEYDIRLLGKMVRVIPYFVILLGRNVEDKARGSVSSCFVVCSLEKNVTAHPLAY